MVEQATATSGGARHSYVQALIPLDKIERREQVRKDWDSDEAKEALEGLTESVKQYGVLQPLLVAPVAGTDRYQVIAGSRRTTAMTAAGEPAAPCLIINVKDEADVLLMQLQENVQRRDLSPIEEGDGYRKLMEARGWSTEEVGRRLGVGGFLVRTKVRVAQDALLRASVESGLIGPTAAYELSNLVAPYGDELRQRLKEGQKVGEKDVRLVRSAQFQAGVRNPNSSVKLSNQGWDALTEEQKQRIRAVKELHANGMSVNAIQRRLSIGYDTIHRYLSYPIPAGADDAGQQPAAGITYTVDARDSIVRDVQDVPAAPPHPAAPILDLTAPPTHVITSEPAKVENAARSPLPMRTHTSEPAGQPTPEPAIDPDAKWMQQMVGMVPASQFNWLDAIANRAAERGWSGYELRSRIRAARAATRA